MKKIIILMFVYLINIKAVDIIDYETGECVNLYQCQELDSLQAPKSSIVDWQSLATESMVEHNFDNTSTANLWEHGPVWAQGR